MSESEKLLALIHPVIVPDTDYPKEYSILVTGTRSVLIRQPKSRNSFVLRDEMRYGTALVTDVTPKTLEDYDQSSLDVLAGDSSNISIPHGKVSKLIVRGRDPEFRKRDFFIWLTMKRQGHLFRVYEFELHYLAGEIEKKINMFMVPLGVYLKPREMSQNREDILNDYAMEAFRVYESVLPANLITPETGRRAQFKSSSPSSSL